jgi:hypothetical protein
MLAFVFEYRKAYNEITGHQDMKLRDYELSEDEWKIIKDLRDVLKVSA